MTDLFCGLSGNKMLLSLLMQLPCLQINNIKFIVFLFS
jgi:hypothetical protein